MRRAATAWSSTPLGDAGAERRRDPRSRARRPAPTRPATLPGGGTRDLRRTTASWSPTTAPRRPARSACWARPSPAPDGPAAAPRGGAVPPARSAGALRLRADRHRRRRAPGQGRRLQPRHPARGGPPLHPGRAPQRRAAAARHPARPHRLPRPWRRAGSGRCATRGSGSRSTPSGGWAGTRCPAARSARSARARSTARRPGSPARPSRRPAAEAVRAAPVPDRHGRGHPGGSRRARSSRWSSTSTASAPRGRSWRPYHAVARPRQFRMGFKLFYDEDVRRMKARDVRAIRPKVRFVSFQ